jgi:hypothetical protein
MKKKIIYAVCFIVFLITAPSCSKTCSTCQIVTRDKNGAIVDSGSGTQYCGADLIAFKAANPTVTNTSNGNVTSVECN